LINGKKKRFHVQNCPCSTVGAIIGYELGLLVHDKVFVEFDRKVILVDCLIFKNMWRKLALQNALKRFLAHKNCKCNRSRQHNCDEEFKWRHSVGSSSSYPFQSRYDVGTGLRIMAHG